MWDKKTPEQWISDLIAGKYKTVGNARKSIAKVNWTDRMRLRARQLIIQYFRDPGSVRMEDMLGPIKISKEDLVFDRPSKAKAKIESAMSPRLASTRQLTYACRELLDTLSLAKALYPDADISNGQVIVDRMLNHVIAEMLLDVGKVGKINCTNTVPKDPIPSAPPIVPNFTPEQKELFARVKPKTMPRVS